MNDKKLLEKFEVAFRTRKNAKDALSLTIDAYSSQEAIDKAIEILKVDFPKFDFQRRDLYLYLCVYLW
jgi:hypothetical protein